MISPIGSGYSSPVYIQPPDLQNNQDTQVSSSVAQKAGVRKGIAEYQDSYVSPQFEDQSIKSAETEKSKKNNFEIRFHIEETDQKWVRRYENLRMVNEAQKAEQTNAFRPDQPVAQIQPAVDPALNAAITANMLSMIRV